MSDQDSTAAANEVGALELEIVPVEEAEAEAAAAREVEANVAEDKAEEELAAVEPDMDDDLFVTEGEQDTSTAAEEAPEETAAVVEEESPQSRERVANDSLGDDVMLFDDEQGFSEQAEADDDDGFLVIDDTPEKTRPSASATANSGDTKLASAADIEGLTEIVLDAAGAANEAAHSTNQSIHMLLGSVTTINKMAKDLRKTNSYVLGFLAIMGFLGLMSGGVMLYVLQGAVKDATAISVAMATKMVRFERGFETQLGRLAKLETQLVDVADTSHALGMRVEQAVHFMDEAGTVAQQAVSSQATQSQQMLGNVNDQIATSFAQMQKVSEQQQAVLGLLKQRIESLEGQMKKVQNQDLVGKMKALIALEQQRYYELEQAKLDQQQAIFEAQQEAAKEAKPITDTFITYGVQSETSN